MIHQTMSEHEALRAIRPRTRRDWKTMRSIAGFIALVCLIVIALFIFHRKEQEQIAQTWQSATATIEDVRPVIASRTDSELGGAMLYQLEVLVRYPSNDIQQRRWIRIGQRPTSLSDAQLKVFAGKANNVLFAGQSCNPTTSSQKLTEASVF